MPHLTKATILHIESVKDGIFQLVFQSHEISKEAKPGQFINVRCGDSDSPLLRRPISICEVNKEEGTVTIFFEVKRVGTKILSGLQKGESIDCVGPSGKGFSLEDEKTHKPYQNILVLGGGIGIFPLYDLLKNSKASKKSVFLGFRSKNFVVLEQEFINVSDEFSLYTDDGSYGKKGVATENLSEVLEDNSIDMVYACGPNPMLKAIVEITNQTKTPTQISMEQRMGCGIGACLVCACKVKEGEGFSYKRVCKDGPVFWADEVIFD